jgi:hypothetical protein
MTGFGKFMLLSVAPFVASAAMAQDKPAAAKPDTAAVTAPGEPACAPGQPIGGIVVKGGKQAEQCVTPTTSASEPAEGKGRTYTGGRRTADAPDAAAVEAESTGVSTTNNSMPSRLSMTPTTAKTAEPPAEAGKSISEKGVSRPH